MTRAYATSLLLMMRLHQPELREVARQMKHVDDYDAPCRAAASMQEAIHALQDMLERKDHPALSDGPLAPVPPVEEQQTL